ncbi:MAG: hypothetical protein GYA16_14630 [Spirochaetes bacterium]|nr:hypothetical protein [Spirochaetota bacterium]
MKKFLIKLTLMFLLLFIIMFCSIPFMQPYMEQKALEQPVIHADFFARYPEDLSNSGRVFGTTYLTHDRYILPFKLSEELQVGCYILSPMGDYTAKYYGATCPFDMEKYNSDLNS